VAAALAVATAVAAACSPADNAEPTVDEPAVRLVVVAHGQSSDPFWSIVANGVNDAARELDVRVEYQAPVSFDMVRMNQLIEAAVASRPDGLIVSVPDADALGSAIEAAIAKGIPVLSINAGAESWMELGVIAHIGQTEYESAFAGGQRLAAAGATRVLCVNHEVGNISQDERCHGLADAMSDMGGTATVLAVDLADPDDAQQRITGALAANPSIDGVFTLGPGGAVPALAALKATSRLSDIAFGTFDLEPDILAAIRDGEVLFAIDQQPWLQGWLGVALMVKYLQTGAVPGGGRIVRTGPAFVTRDNAARVIELSRQGIR
jgi:simple sugar transport system substrate-binding protein